MRLLFDEQLSDRLPSQLADLYPDSTHVVAIGLAGAPDESVWQAAIRQRCMLVLERRRLPSLDFLELGAAPDA